MIAVAVAFGAAGCGGRPESAARVFSSACAGCHTLAGHETGRVIGGDLGRRRMTVAEVKSFVDVMPLRRPLSASEVRAVSDYVSRAQRRLAR